MPGSNRIGRIYVGIDVTWNENIPLNESSYFEPLESILNVITPVKSNQITDFEYLVGLSHIDHDILYEVTRIGKSQGFIVAWRKPVFSAGHYGREEEAPIHVRDIEALMATHYDHLANFDHQPETTNVPPPDTDSDCDDTIFSMQQFQQDCINIVKTDGVYKRSKVTLTKVH